MVAHDGAVSTQDAAYAERLERMAGARWKQVIGVQRVYQWKLRAYHLGVTLDVGCGIGRNLHTLGEGSHGVDHNADSIRLAQAQGFSACTADYLFAYPGFHEARYDSLLFSHVLEHMTKWDAETLVRSYLRFMKPDGRVLFICPQERGYASDATHVTYLTGDDLRVIARRVGLRPAPSTSFPFPRFVGRWFTYNETHVLAGRSG